MDYFHPLDVTKRASEESRSKLNAKLADLPADTIAEVFPHLTRFLLSNLSQEELATNKEKTNRHLRLAELLQEHSSAAELIVMYGKHYYIKTKTKTLQTYCQPTNHRTLPMPRRGHTSAPLYLTW